MLLSPFLLAATLALVVIATIPTRRLFLAGVGRRALTTYLLALVVLGVLAVSGRGPEQVLVPCFVVAFAAPLVASPAVIGRFLRRGSAGGHGGRRAPDHLPVPRLPGSRDGRDGQRRPPGDAG